MMIETGMIETGMIETGRQNSEKQPPSRPIGGTIWSW
jgi:hypothetical protein